MQSRKFAAAAVLRGSGIDRARLDDWDYLIDFSQSQRVCQNMIELTGNPRLGFELGSHIDYSDLGILGYALMSSRTLREIIDTWKTVSHSVIGSPLNIALEENGDLWRVTFTEAYPFGSLQQFCTEEIFAIGHLLSARVMGKPFKYKKLEFAYPPPDDAHIYHDFFQTDIAFNAPVTATNVFSPGLDEPSSRVRDPEFYQMCREYCFDVLGHLRRDKPVAFKVRQLLLDSPGALPCVRDAASALHYSERTLKRHLGREGVTYQKLVNQFKNDMAKEYLKSRHRLSLEKISDLLGYSDVSSLSRAFSAWNNGLTPGEYRKSLSQ